MKFNFQQGFRALILLFFSFMIFNLHWTDEIKKFVNPKYENLSMTAAILFFILFLVQITRVVSFSNRNQQQCQHGCCSHDHQHTTFRAKKLITYTIILTPILTGFLLPAKVLDAALAEKKGGMMLLTNQQKKVENYITSDETIVEDIYATHEPDIGLIDGRKEMNEEEYDLFKEELLQKSTIQMTDENYLIYYEDMNKDYTKYIGRKIQIKGFVLKEESFAQNQLVISRFLITHCIADASIVGFLSEFPEANTLDEDSWIEAWGTIDIVDFNGDILPLIKVDEWVKIEEPSTPYLYPIDVFISSS